MIKRLAFLTGKRGGYEAMVPTLQELEKADVDIWTIPVDQHLRADFGGTFENVGFRKYTFHHRYDYEDGPIGRLEAGASILSGLGGALTSIRPDMLMLIGDRLEALMGAIVAHNLRIPIAHIQGGDVTGGVDDAQRHAITKLSHLHFVSTVDAALRVQRMGEDDWRVHVVGDAHIDQIKLGWMTDFTDLIHHVDFNVPLRDPYLLVLYHPDTLHPERTAGEFAAIKQGVLDSGIKPIWVFPCTDQGFQTILDQLEGLENVHRNIPSRDFLTLLKHAVCIVGNSSCGLIEAPYFGTPAFNIGSRQDGRARGNSVYNLAAVPGTITDAIKTFEDKPCPQSEPFGDGTAYKQITEVITSLEITGEFLDKRIKY